MNTRNISLFAILLVLVIAIAPVTAQEASLTWTLPDYSGGAIAASILDENLITVEVTGIDEAAAPMVNVTCRNVETDEAGSVLLNPITRQTNDNGITMQFDVASQWMGLPYPVDPWALESKPMAIISERAQRSPNDMTPAEIREEFSWVSGYMLETARHSYSLPFGDGVLECYFQMGDLTSEPLEVVFGRGLPETVFERDFSIADTSDWATWVVDAVETPAPQTANWEALPYEGTPQQIALMRYWDNGAAVSPWIEITMGSIIENHVNPPRASRIYGLVSVAMYDALVAGNGQYSEHALAAGAASTVLSYLFPDQSEEWSTLAVEAMQTRVWAEDANPNDLQTAFVLGQQVGNLVVERAKNDGSTATFEGTRPEGDAFWVPDLPSFAGPQEPMTGTWLPWNLSSGDQFRPAPPPEFGTPEFEAEAREVYEAGINLTLEQQMIASFWEDKLGTTTPPGHWNLIALHLVREAGLSSADAARVFATMNTAQADAFIAAWDAKYTYWSVRPITAIRRLFDENWTPYIYTPGFPSYISGHSTTSGAASTVLAAFFPEHAEELTAWAIQAMDSRLLGGIHYRSDNEVGLVVGQQVGGEALAKVGLR